MRAIREPPVLILIRDDWVTCNGAPVTAALRRRAPLGGRSVVDYRHRAAPHPM